LEFIEQLPETQEIATPLCEMARKDGDSRKLAVSIQQSGKIKKLLQL
jgi:hypothetical protein